MIKAGLIEKDIEKAYANALRLRKKINDELKRIPARKKVRVRSRAYENLEKLSKCSIEYEVTNKTHSVDYSNDIDTQSLINILQKGRKKMKPRPFLDRFKKQLKVDFPNARDMNTLDFAVIKKDIEDKIDSQFAEAMLTNSLKLSKLKYREGTPLVRSGTLIKSIRWRLVEQ